MSPDTPANAHVSPTPPAAGPRWCWEDLTTDLQLSFGPKRVDRDEVIAFARQFDPQPFHLSEEAGKASLFGGLAASGWHTCGMVMKLMCDGFILDSSSLGSPGLEGLKWLKPVMVGDELTARLTIIDRRPMKSRADVGLTRSLWEAVNQRGEVVLTIDSWAMFRLRQPV